MNLFLTVQIYFIKQPVTYIKKRIFYTKDPFNTGYRKASGEYKNLPAKLFFQYYQSGRGCCSF
jgi:hypothetical protein